jgi:hypothetical protein
MEELEDISSDRKKIKPTLIACCVLFTLMIILVDLVLFDFRWRPEAQSILLLYGWLANGLAIVSLIFLIVYTARNVSKRVSNVLSIMVLVICILAVGVFAIGIHAMTKRTPEFTLKPEGYNHVYYLYPQSRLFARRGYGIYIPDSDYTLTYYEGYSAMDYDTSYVLDGHFYIKFDGMSRLFRPEENHLFKFDLSVPQY